MNLIKSSNHLEEYNLYIITPKGNLRALKIPFQVRCLTADYSFKLNTFLYVEAVSAHKNHVIIYRILGNWYPFNHFKIKIKYF